MGKKHKRKVQKNVPENISEVKNSINEGNTSFFEIVKNSTDTANIIKGFCMTLSGIGAWALEYKGIACIVVGILLGIAVKNGVEKLQSEIPKRGMFAGILAAVMGSLTSLTAIGYINIDLAPGEKISTGQERPLIQENRIPEMMAVTEVEKVESTESPLATYEKMTFEEQIPSSVWRDMLISTEQVGVTGTENNFHIISVKTMQIIESYRPTRAIGNHKVIDSRKIRENIEEINRIDIPEKTWESCDAISRMRCENYEENPILENARLKGIASLDCLYKMGMVNGKEQKRLEESIYNKENILQYGGQAIDGHIEWWYAMTQIEGVHDYGAVSYGFGQIFHHLSGASEMTTEEVSISHLVLAAVFYSNTVVADERFYETGQATTEQYNACKNLAIVCDKLDNKLKPEEPFYLLLAERNYRCALYNVNMNQIEEEKVKKYLNIVKDKKRRRGL